MSKTKFNQVAKDCSFLVFYASQTGQAESIGENIVQQAAWIYDLKSEIFPLNDIRDLKDLANLPCPVVIVASSTGDGEPPENADRFWRRIRKKALDCETLKGLRFALLGLGDTNYNQFCNCPKVINKRLLELGAVHFYPPAWADDAVGLELVVEDWIENLWPSLEKLIRPDGVGLKMSEKAKENGGLQLPICPSISLELEFDDSLQVVPVCLDDPVQPYPLIDGFPITATIEEARYLTKPGAVKTALELTFKCQTVFQFQPGDAVSIVCPNPGNEVDQLITRLNLVNVADKVAIMSVKEGAKGKIPMFLPPGASVRQWLTHYFDIRSAPKKNFLRLLAEFTSNESERNKMLELCSKQGSTLFESTIRFPNLSFLDILLTFPTCQPPVEAIVEHLPRLIPRPYSISSSPLTSRDSFTVVFNVLTFTPDEGRQYARTGICTGWLFQLARKKLNDEEPLTDGLDPFIESFGKLSVTENGPLQDQIIIYRRKGHNFRLPEDMTSPLITIGPGTGIAPFVGFAEHRQKLNELGNQIGEMYMYFGCRNKALDFLYKEKLEGLRDDQVITKLYTSFSRDPDQNGIKYVQHNMERNKEELINILLEKRGYLYVCGDAKNMAKNVRDALTHCIQHVKEVPEEDAKSLISSLIAEKRYLQDVWS